MEGFVVRLIIALTLFCCAGPLCRGEICSDVLRSLSAGELSASLSTEEPWYVPGELVSFRMSFKNNSNKLLLIPRAKGLAEVVEFLSPVNDANGETIRWTSVVTIIPKSLDYHPCETTDLPEVLLAGDTTSVRLSDMEY